MKLIDYRVITADSRQDLRDRVMEVAKGGYVLLGGVCCDDYSYYQAMALYTE